MLYSGPASFNRLNLNIGPSCTSLLSECCCWSLQPQNHGELTTPKTSHPHLPTLGSKISYLNDCLRYTLSNMHRHVDLNLNTGNMIYIYIILYYIILYIIYYVYIYILHIIYITYYIYYILYIVYILSVHIADWELGIGQLNEHPSVFPWRF